MRSFNYFPLRVSLPMHLNFKQVSCLKERCCARIIETRRHTRALHGSFDAERKTKREEALQMMH